MASLSGGIGHAFADRNFRFYSVGAIVSWLSFFIQVVAVSWTTWELTHSTKWLATIAVLDILPNILFLPLAGVLADRMDRFRLLVGAYCLALLQALALTVLSFTGHLDITALAILAFLHGLIHSFSMPAFYGLLPRFIAKDRLASAIAVAAAYSQLAIFAGPALAGWIILHWGAGAAFATNVVGYGIYLASVSLMKTPDDYVLAKPTGKSILADFRDGIGYIAGHPGIRAIMLLMLLGDALSSAVYQMLPAFSANGLGMGVEGVAMLMAAAGIGATLSALWIAHGGAGRISARRVFWAFLAFVLSVGLLMSATHVVLAVVAMLAFGISGELRRTGTVALFQISIDDAQRGRVMSSQFLLQRVAGGIGTVMIGALAEGAGLRVPMLLAVGLAVFVWAVTYFRRASMFAAFEKV